MTDPWLIQNTTNYVKTQDNNESESPQSSLQKTQQLQQQEVEKGTSESNCFEDNFAPSVANSHLHNPLPDSVSYLQGLERKLQKIKKGTNLVDSLAEKRQDCMRTLLLEGEDNSVVTSVNNNDILEFDAPISIGDSTVQVIYRQLQPVQPVTVGETVHIVKYDQLEEQRRQHTEESEGKEIN